MAYYKFIDNGYIVAVGTGGMGEQITEQEYSQIMAVIAERPSDTETVGYKLKSDLTWESYEKQPEPYIEEPDAEEIVSILTGESE